MDFKISASVSKTLTEHSNSVRQVLFLPSGRLASCSDDQTIKLWDISTGNELFQLTGHTGRVLSLALLPNGWLASGSEDKTIKLWDQQEEIRTLRGHTEAVISLKVLKNGHLVSASLDDTLRIWNPYFKEKDNFLCTIQGHGNHSFFPLFGLLSNDHLVTCSFGGQQDCVLMVHDPTNGQRVKSLPTGQKDDAQSLLVLSNDQVVVGFSNGSIKIFELNGGESRSIDRAHSSNVRSLFQLSNGSLVSSGEDGNKSTIKVWNLEYLSLLQCINTDQTSIIFSIDVSQDETLLATGSGDRSISIWPIE